MPFYQPDSMLLPLVRDHLVSGISRLLRAQRLLVCIAPAKFGLQ